MSNLRLFIALAILVLITIKASKPVKKRKKRRTSGNGTSARQWLYIIANFPFFFVVKVGITGNLSQREKDIDKSAPGIDKVIFAIKIRYAYQVEQTTHKLCSFMRIPFWGSGKTERFFILAAVPAFLFSIGVFLLEWAVYLSPVVVIIWIAFKN